MNTKNRVHKDSTEKAVRDIRRATRRHYSAEEKIRIVLAGLRVEDSIAELCRKEDINQNVYDRRSKEFLETGKKRLAGDTAREAHICRSQRFASGGPGAERSSGGTVDGESSAQKKRARGWGGRYMRYSASEKREMIKLVEQSSLPVSQTLRRLDINKSTFYNWLQRYRCAGDEALTDKHSGPNRAWNQLPESRQIAVVDLALSEPELSPRELAVKYTDEQAYFISESTVYRLLKAQDLITSPAYILMQASNQFQQPTTRVNQMWQTDFTYLKVIGWGWYCLSPRYHLRDQTALLSSYFFPDPLPRFLR